MSDITENINKEYVEAYINTIIDACNDAPGGMRFTFTNYGMNRNLRLEIQKDANYKGEGDDWNMIDIVVYKQNVTDPRGRKIDIAIGDEMGIHMLDCYRVLLGIADGSRKLSLL